MKKLMRIIVKLLDITNEKKGKQLLPVVVIIMITGLESFKIATIVFIRFRK